MPLLDIEEIQEFSPIFRGKIGKGIAEGLMHLLAIDKINRLYDSCSSLSDTQFTSAILERLGVRYEVINSHILSQLPAGPFITVSNHPYGSIDGIMLVDMIGSIRPDYKVMVNRFLSRIVPLEQNFIYVKPTGENRTVPEKESIMGIKATVAHIRSGHPLGLFPSGAVSDFSLKDGCIRDRQWQESAISLISRMNVPVIPIRFLDRNSSFYYGLGLIHWKIRLLRLPSEVFNKSGRRTRIKIGQVIQPEQLSGYRDLTALGEFLRNSVYNL